MEATAPIERRATPVLPLLIEALAERFGTRPALESNAGTRDYRSLGEGVRRHARWALEQGLRPGDVVGLLMPNCPDYMVVWLGLNRVGIAVALLNVNLTGELLAHAIRSVAPRFVIGAGRLAQQLQAVRAQVPAAVHFLGWGAGSEPLERMDTAVAACSAEPPAADHALPGLDDRALCIYTSGTTGAPKAANVSHGRVLQWTHWFAGMMDMSPGDRMYDCLPMYHSIGGVVAPGATLLGGGTVVIRERFSASEFWSDIVAERCTVFQYIGELCRYLLANAPDPRERAHSLRLCCGNGLRADVWEQFRVRFGIPQILEYYAATEANFSLYNCEGKPGAIGRIPPFISQGARVALVKFDHETGAPWRNESGWCERCQASEVGEAIGQVTGASAAGRFEGYTSATASEGKLLRGVFEPGDLWYRSGDLMRKDAQGFFYFVDRVGDTFRWKGENVSTTEVETVLASCDHVTHAVVYGVHVAHADGRAGMAALITEPAFLLDEFARVVTMRLPEYARPLFLRVVPTIELTGTFRPQKADLVRQGFDPAAVSGQLYLYDRGQKMYVALDRALYESVLSGTLRL